MLLHTLLKKYNCMRLNALPPCKPVHIYKLSKLKSLREREFHLSHSDYFVLQSVMK